MNKINIDKFSEEIRYAWECECGQMNDEFDEAKIGDEITCCGCLKEFEVEG